MRKRHNRQKENHTQRIIKNLQEENENLECMIANKDFIIGAVTKESNQNAMAAKYLSHILIIMDTLEIILDDNCTMGRIVKKAFSAFRRKLSE